MLLHLAEKNQDQGFVEMWCVRIQLWSLWKVPQVAEGDNFKDLFEDNKLNNSFGNRYFVTMKNKMTNFKNVQIERLEMEGT